MLKNVTATTQYKVLHIKKKQCTKAVKQLFHGYKEMWNALFL